MHAHVLIIGVKGLGNSKSLDTVVANLQKVCPGWILHASVNSRFRDAFSTIENNESIELVHLCNEMEFSHVMRSRSCEDLAKKIAAHQRYPWVSFGPDYNHFQTVFRRFGIHVFNGSLVDALADRWRCFGPKPALLS